MAGQHGCILREVPRRSGGGIAAAAAAAAVRLPKNYEAAFTRTRATGFDKV